MAPGAFTLSGKSARRGAAASLRTKLGDEVQADRIAAAPRDPCLNPESPHAAGNYMERAKGFEPSTPTLARLRAVYDQPAAFTLLNYNFIQYQSLSKNARRRICD